MLVGIGGGVVSIVSISLGVSSRGMGSLVIGLALDVIASDRQRR